MPNDAKLGLLFGAAGVLMAALMIGPKAPAPAPTAAVPKDAVAETAPSLPATQAAVPASRTPSMPTNYAAAKGKPEVSGTPVARKAEQDR